MKYIDLHVHSNKSDGTLSPTQIVELAKTLDLYAIALTDHDTISGIDEAMEAASILGVILIPGIEISSEFNGGDLHILGLNIDYKNVAFNKLIDILQDERKQRNVRIIELMRQDGVDISENKLRDKFGDASITRAHFARYLVETGYINHKDMAFAKYLNKGRPYYVPRQRVSPKDAINIILEAGGHPVLAHPLLYGLGRDRLMSLFNYLKELGLQGIEALHSLNSPADDRMLLGAAKRYDLFITGGSDFHGANKPNIQLGIGKGNLKIPAEILDNII